LADKVIARSVADHSVCLAPAAKQLAIAAKMKALTDQISKDFKKVTGYGKQAGYVPPPKIPHV
jgi:hypothetical protein